MKKSKFVIVTPHYVTKQERIPEIQLNLLISCPWSFSQFSRKCHSQFYANVVWTDALILTYIKLQNQLHQLDWLIFYFFSIHLNISFTVFAMRTHVSLRKSADTMRPVGLSVITVGHHLMEGIMFNQKEEKNFKKNMK